MRIPRYAVLTGAALVAALGVAALGVVRSHDSAAASTAVPSTLPGELTGPSPWGRNGAQLGPRLDALRLPTLAFEGTALHIHQHLDVFVNGKRVVVPAGVGIDPAGRFISPLHTHDTTGVIHVESPMVRPFTLGEFFGVWGVRLGPGRVGGYTAGKGRTLRAYVDGRAVSGDPGKIVLAPHEEIVLAFGTARQLPHPVPSSYAFPPGL